MGNAHLAPSNVHPLATNAHLTPAAHAAAFHADPHSFAEHRHLAGDPAWRPFWNHGWHPHRHLGWIGPLFWPYAYGDFFYYALWPDDYYDADPFWPMAMATSTRRFSRRGAEPFFCFQLL